MRRQGPWSYLKYAGQKITAGGTLYGLCLMRGTANPPAATPSDPWTGNAEIGGAILNNTYPFAGQQIRQARNPWEAAGADDAWMKAMNGFDWIRDLRAVGSDSALTKVRDLTRDWLSRNDRLDAVNANPDSWTAAATSNRLLAWLYYWPAVFATADAELQQQMLKSVGRQLRHLSVVSPFATTPLDRVVGLKGQIVGYLLWLPHEGAREQSLVSLEREISQQILPDGSPTSRNPLDLVKLLQELVEIRLAYLAAREEVPPVVQHTIDRCVPMTHFFRHGDGGLCHFNGSRDSGKAPLDHLLSLTGAKGKPPQEAPYSGYERLKAGTLLMLADCGAPPPAPFDRLAHAGIGSFEVSIGTDRMIVNCGASNAGRGDWLEAERSTAAHSTLCVDDTNSSALNRKQGIGKRRAEPTCHRDDSEDAHWLSITHDGYAALFGLQHARRLYVTEDGLNIRGEDRLTCSEGVEDGAGHDFAVRFHLHPKVSISLLQNQSSALLRLPSGQGWRFRCFGAKIQLEDSIYLGGDTPRRAQQIVLRGTTETDGAVVKWAFNKE